MLQKGTFLTLFLLLVQKWQNVQKVQINHEKCKETFLRQRDISTDEGFGGLTHILEGKNSLTGLIPNGIFSKTSIIIDL